MRYKLRLGLPRSFLFPLAVAGMVFSPVVPAHAQTGVPDPTAVEVVGGSDILFGTGLLGFAGKSRRRLSYSG
jgi:hypothetical protein